MHPVDVENALKTFSVIVDSREQKWAHIKNALTATETPYTVRGLNYGDYTCEVQTGQDEPFTMADRVVIERKANLDELVGNFTKGRERFDREFRRALDDKAKMFLLIEEPDLWRNIIEHRYRSQMPPKSLLATLCSWQAKYNITVIACDKRDSGTIIKAVLWYAVRDCLLKEDE